MYTSPMPPEPSRGPMWYCRMEVPVRAAILTLFSFYLAYPTEHSMAVSSPDTTTADGKLVRRLGLWSSLGLVIGITIGSGIFRTPAVIATRVPDPTLMLAVWVL